MADPNTPDPTVPGRDDRVAGAPFWVTRRGALIALTATHAAALIAVLVEFLHPLVGAEHGVERAGGLEFFASYAAFGFVACVALVLLGRLLRRLVMRGENYYADHDR